MADREKLIEILRVPTYPHELADPAEVVADYLLDNGVTVQRWIPVTERLPEVECHVYSVDVLFYVRDDGIYAGYVNHETGTWKCRCHAVKFAKNRVTHWMPLPPAPKEVK